MANCQGMMMHGPWSNTGCQRCCHVDDKWQRLCTVFKDRTLRTGMTSCSSLCLWDEFRISTIIIYNISTACTC
eukprot:6212764-Pleurochrysis_carterae.AAC.6